MFYKLTLFQGMLKQMCRENEYCLRLCLEEIKDGNTFVSANDMAEIESKLILLYFLFVRISNSYIYLINIELYVYIYI